MLKSAELVACSAAKTAVLKCILNKVGFDAISGLRGMATLSAMFLNGWDSHVLLNCPFQAVWLKVNTALYLFPLTGSSAKTLKVDSHSEMDQTVISAISEYSSISPIFC